MATNNCCNQSSTGLQSLASSGSYFGRSIVPPASGFTVNNPDGASGNPTFVLNDDLAALEALASTGLLTRTGTNTYSLRTLTGTVNLISVTNGNGVSGNPTVDFSTGFYATGTFTPTVEGSTSAGVATYVLQNGFYTRLGRNVFIQARISWSAHTGTGNVVVKNLPFVVATTSGTQHFFIDPEVTTSTTFTRPYPYIRAAGFGLSQGTVGSYTNSGGAYFAENIATNGNAMDLTIYNLYQAA